MKEKGKEIALNLEGIELNDDSKIQMPTFRMLGANQKPESKKIIKKA